MKCYCKDDGEQFTFYVENSPEYCWDEIEKAFFQRNGDVFTKAYPSFIRDKTIIADNFARFAPDMFLRSAFCWEAALEEFCRLAQNNGIRWCLIGSMTAVIRGIDIVPHDIDIVVSVDDFEKAREVFLPFIIEPFVDNGGTWVVRYFGRICIAGVMIDIAADKRFDESNDWDFYRWKNFLISAEGLDRFYEVNVARKRLDYACKIKEYLTRNHKV